MAFQKSVVKVVGTLKNGEGVVQEFTLSHDPSTPPDALLGQVLGEIRKVGGMTVKTSKDTMVYYPGHVFDKLEFTVNAVVLAHMMV